ncbi:MAG: retropepsin-like aspartic protease [Clostridium sp.]|uniref:retropepsin-like aspartic protease n=1 Tax=Clostridium sp. TaxID=1506 RepID=UPI003F315FDA
MSNYTKSTDEKYCFNCKKKGHTTKACFFNKKYCNHCKTNTHNTAVCYKLNKTQQNLVIEELNPSSVEDIAVKGFINGQKVKAIVDTASCKSFMSSNMIKKLDLQVEETRPLTTIFGSGNRETTCQSVNLSLQLNGKKIQNGSLCLEESPSRIDSWKRFHTRKQNYH